jgi:hypothetical protein
VRLEGGALTRVERQRSVGDSDSADGVGSEVGEPVAGDKAKDGTSEELRDWTESLTRSG